MKRKTRVAAKGKGGRPAAKSKGKNPALEVNKPTFKKSGTASKPKDVKWNVFTAKRLGIGKGTALNT